MSVEIPEVMIDMKVEDIIRNYAVNYGMNDGSASLEQLKRMLGITDEVINMSIRPSAEFQVRSELLFEAVAEAESIDMTDEDLNEYVKKIAESTKISEDDVVRYFGMEYITEEFKKEKATDVIFNSAVALAPKAEEETKAE